MLLKQKSKQINKSVILNYPGFTMSNLNSTAKIEIFDITYKFINIFIRVLDDKNFNSHIKA